MISAKFARETAKRAQESDINSIIEKVEKAIKEAARVGKTNIFYGYDLPIEVKNVLIECGYTLTCVQYRKEGERGYNISW